ASVSSSCLGTPAKPRPVMLTLHRPICLAFSGLICLQAFADVELPEPEGVLLMSIELKESAFSGVPAGKHGYFLYVKDAGAFVRGPLVTGYRYDNGKLIDVFGGGSSGSVWFLEKLEDLGVRPFEYSSALASARILESQDSSGVEMDEAAPVGMNDGTYEISYSYQGVSVKFSEENPGPVLRRYSKYNDNISQFSELVNLMSTYYGLMKIGM
ncbi:MAG: hypothetical protein AAGB46_13065, partial [Verrucomicrobiota bacterium]